MRFTSSTATNFRTCTGTATRESRKRLPRKSTFFWRMAFRPPRSKCCPFLTSAKSVLVLVVGRRTILVEPRRRKPATLQSAHSRDRLSRRQRRRPPRQREQSPPTTTLQTAAVHGGSLPRGRRCSRSTRFFERPSRSSESSPELLLRTAHGEVTWLSV